MYDEDTRSAEMEDWKRRERLRRRLIIAVACAAVIAVLAFASVTIVPSGDVGVLTTAGQIDPNAIQSGWKFHAPFVQFVELVNVKQQDRTFDGQIWSETAERNALYFENVTVTYTINGSRAPWICANVTDWRQTLVDSGIVASAVKAAAKEFSPTDVTNRKLVEPRVQELLQESMNKKYGDGTVLINKVTVAEVEFEESYQKSIEDKQKIQMEYEQQQIANQKNIEKAEADAEVQRTTAEAEADAARIRAEGEADANRTIADSLSEDILRNRYYESWDGRLPQVVSSGGAGTMVEIPYGSGTTAPQEQEAAGDEVENGQ